jgi:hypothetical protein
MKKKNISAQDVLPRAVHGDMRAFKILSQQPHGQLIAQRASLSDLVLTKNDLLRVLASLRDGHSSPDLIQQWASFVRRGYVADTSQGPVRPIAIDYEPSQTEAIVEIVARLDELGDTIDGAISKSELHDMIASLQEDAVIERHL